ncbi:unnamed protein product [Closterium sp. Yama58-4]|nr:unnamed protein product [Closterium sp. Yama58-4]
MLIQGATFLRPSYTETVGQIGATRKRRRSNDRRRSNAALDAQVVVKTASNGEECRMATALWTGLTALGGASPCRRLVIFPSLYRRRRGLYRQWRTATAGVTSTVARISSRKPEKVTVSQRTGGEDGCRCVETVGRGTATLLRSRVASWAHDVFRGREAFLTRRVSRARGVSHGGTHTALLSALGSNINVPGEVKQTALAATRYFYSRGNQEEREVEQTALAATRDFFSRGNQEEREVEQTALAATRDFFSRGNQEEREVEQTALAATRDFFSRGNQEKREVEQTALATTRDNGCSLLLSFAGTAVREWELAASKGGNAGGGPLPGEAGMGARIAGSCGEASSRRGIGARRTAAHGA